MATAQLSIQGNRWCFKTKDKASLGISGYGATVRDAQTDFNRNVGSLLKSPSLLGPEVRQQYGLSKLEYEEMGPGEFVERYERMRKIMEGSRVCKD